MNTSITPRTIEIAATQNLVNDAQILVVVALIICVVVREIGRGTGRYGSILARDADAAVIPLALIGVVAMLERIILLYSSR